MSAATLERTGYRLDILSDSFDRIMVDGNILIVNTLVDDVYVHDGAIRDLVRSVSTEAAARGMATLRYTLADQVEAINAPGGPKAHEPDGVAEHTPPTVALDMLRDSALNQQLPHLLVFDFMEHLLPAEQMHSASGDTARIVEQLAALAANTKWKDAGHRIVLVGRTAPVDSRLSGMPGMTVVELGLPEESERVGAINLMLGSGKHPLVLAADLSPEHMARATGGLPIKTISMLRYHTTPDAPLDLSDILECRRPAIRKMARDTLIVHDELIDLGRDVAGLLPVRRFLQEEVLRLSRAVRLLLCGPPGNGKTRVASAIASFLGIPMIELGHILNRYVGDSEANIKIALDTAVANAPCLLFLDEVDQTFLGRRGEAVGAEGGQVTANLRAAIFSWLGDVGADRGISVVAATNRPDLLDEASLDRFTSIPVLHPSPSEAAQIMAIQARAIDLEFDVDGAALALVEARAAFSGRQAVRLLGRAQVHAVEAGDSAVGGTHVAAAIGESMQRIGVEEERQSLLAIRATSWAGHLPWNAARYFGDASAMPPDYVASLVDDDGRVDLGALDARIVGLGGMRGY